MSTTVDGLASLCSLATPPTSNKKTLEGLSSLSE
jgi:hypothetical protein